MTRVTHYNTLRMALAIALAISISATGAEFEHRPLDQLEPGITLAQAEANPNQRLLLLAEPRLAGGDLDKTPPGSDTFISMFKLVLMADVANDGDALQPSYRIQRVAAGMAINQDGQTIVVSSKTKTPNAGLGLIAKTILSTNERFLDDVVAVARTKTITVFDAKAMMLRDGEHQPMQMRHVVWIAPRSGRINMALWMLKQDEGDRFQLASDEMQVFGEGLHEDRQLHVDASRFAFGIPTEEAFALMQVPRGKSVPFSDGFRKHAALRQFDDSSLNQFVGLLVENLRQAVVARRN